MRMHGAQVGDPAMGVAGDFVDMPVNRSLRMLWRAKSCSAKDQTYAAVEIVLPLGANRGVPRFAWSRASTRGDSVMTIIMRVTTAFFALLSRAGFIAMLSTVGLL